MATKESRSLDVNDIIGKKKTGDGGLPPTGLIDATRDRVRPIRPRQNDFDIINPVGVGTNRLRMSSYGKNVLSSRDQQRTNKIISSSPAGVKKKIVQGEANIDQIWPAQDGLRGQFNERNRGFETHDINMNSHNARMLKIREADSQRVKHFLASKEQVSDTNVKPYKNASNVFTHLVDDPSTRKKIGQQSNSCRHLFNDFRSFILLLTTSLCLCKSKPSRL